MWTKERYQAINLVAIGMGNASQGIGGTDSAALRSGEKSTASCTRAGHHANIVPWQQLCARTGAELA